MALGWRQYRRHEQQKELDGLALMMHEISKGSWPRLLMAYNNVKRQCEIHDIPFEQVKRTKSWDIVNDALQTYDISFYRLRKQAAARRLGPADRRAWPRLELLPGINRPNSKLNFNRRRT
jgi:hypothetical protein